MTKIRNSKPKKINDFKKKKVSFNKIKQNNKTIINIKIKKITLLSQNHRNSSYKEGKVGKVDQEGEEIEGEEEEIKEIIKQFYHHSKVHRLFAINEIIKKLKKSLNFHRYLSLILSSCIELLFDNEKEIRNSLLFLFFYIIQKYSKKEFYFNILSIIITYICSGLTSLSKVSISFFFFFLY